MLHKHWFLQLHGRLKLSKTSENVTRHFRLVINKWKNYSPLWKLGVCSKKQAISPMSIYWSRSYFPDPTQWQFYCLLFAKSVDHVINWAIFYLNFKVLCVMTSIIGLKCCAQGRHIIHTQSSFILRLLVSGSRQEVHPGFWYLAFDQGATRLNQIINNHNMPSSCVSLLNTYNSLVTFPNFSTDNLHLIVEGYPAN